MKQEFSHPHEEPSMEEISHLLRLLDDDTPAVRGYVEQRLAQCSGDLSDFLSTWPKRLSANEKSLLSSMLAHGRRRTLEQEWIIPNHGALDLNDDGDAFEASLRLISDFLHDGITLRLSLSDALDLLTEEACAAGVESAADLAKFIFQQQSMRGNHEDATNPSHADLAWVIATGHSTALPLAIIYLLTGMRLDMEIEVVSYPDLFFARIYDHDEPILVDPFHQGDWIDQRTLLQNPYLTHFEKMTMRRAMPLGEILTSLLTSLTEALEHHQRTDDAKLIRKLRRSLLPSTLA